VIDYLSHYITNGHVAHHLFFKNIPHYNLPAATKAVKEMLGDRYVEDDTFFLKAAVTNCATLDYIPDDVDVAQYVRESKKGY